MLGHHPHTKAPITLGMGAKGPYLLMVPPPGDSLPGSDSEEPHSVKRLTISMDEASKLTFDR